MKKIKVIGKFVSFVSGEIKLSKEQYESRKHALQKVDGERDVYLIISPIQFKFGEVVGYSGEISKSSAEFMEEEKVHETSDYKKARIKAEEKAQKET